jgi:acetoin utilization protein AcuB
MRVADVMASDVQTVSPDTAAADAWELMRRKGIHHLVVVADRSIAGVLSDRDAGGRAGGRLRAGSRVSDLMTAPVVTVDSRATVRRTANLMRGRSIGCVPIVDGRRLVGIVTVSDLLELIGRGAGRADHPSRRGLHHRVPHRKRKDGAGVW